MAVLFLRPWRQKPWPFLVFRREDMIIIMKSQATDTQIEKVISWIESVGYKAHPSRGVERTIIGAVGDNRDKAVLKYAESLPGVEKTMPILKPYKLASRESHEGNTIVSVGSIQIGGPEFVVMAGPCAIEIEELLMSAEYILSSGNPNVVLCERGIRTFETATRNTLDLSAVPVLKGLTH